MGYYFISIGGSGAKALEALTHLCAAGAMPSRERLNILAIDPDAGNGNLDRAHVTLKNLEVIQKLDVGNSTPLFKTKFSLIEPFPWKPVEVDMTLDDLMGYEIHAKSPLGNLYEVLYTKKERATRLNEGFRGHPSIGAAVLAKRYTLSAEAHTHWTEFIQKIRGDTGSGGDVKIFLVGSVFGGTGAAGLPTISRLLRNSLSDKGDKISIGAALILPYFDFTPTVEDNGLFARSENFLTSTKAALKYYAQKDNVFNGMYFIGDSQRARVENFSVGSSSQRNDAHIVDFYAALAAADFFAQPVNNSAEFKFIAHGDSQNFSWADFPNLTELVDGEPRALELRKIFVQFARFIFAYAHLVKPVLQKLLNSQLPEYQYPWFMDYFKGVDIKPAEIKNFEEYVEAFALWLEQLESAQLETAQTYEISLIKKSMFTAAPARVVVPREFKSCGGAETSLTFEEIWWRLSEDFEFDSSLSGFGKFLRRLYEACEA